MFKKIASTTATRIVTALISVFVLWLNASKLGPEGIGAIGILILNISIVSLVNSLSGSASLGYFVPRKPLGKLISLSFVSIISGTLLLLLCARILSYFPEVYYRIFLENFLPHIVILSVLQSLYGNNMAVFIGKEKIFMHNLLTLLQFITLLSLLSILYAQAETPGIDHFLIAYYASVCLPLFISSLFVIQWIRKEEKKTATKGLLKEILNFGWAVQTASLVQMLNYRLPYYFLNIPSGKQSLGVYTTANQLSEGLWIFSRSVSMVQYARIANSSDTHYHQRLTLMLFKFTFLITLLALLVIIMIPGDVFVYILKHDEYKDIPMVILALAPGILSLVAKMIFAHYFSGTGRPSINLKASLYSLLVAILSAAFLIPNYGIIGAGISASLTYFAGGLILFVRFQRECAMPLRHFLPAKSDLEDLKTLIRTSKK